MRVRRVDVSALPEVAPEAWNSVSLTATTWDPTLLPNQHGALAMERMRSADSCWLSGDEREDTGGLVGGWLRRLEWDSAYFGVPVATCGLEGAHTQESAAMLAQEMVEMCRQEGVTHLRISERAGAYAKIAGLQDAGFRVRWVSNQITCDTRRLDPKRPPCPPGLDFRPALASDLPAIEEALKSVGPYSWPEFESALPLCARTTYATERTRNCVITDYADLTLLALWRGRVAGFHASKLQQHPTLGTDAPFFAYVRDTFVSPKGPPNLGAHLIRHALHQHVGRARQVTGRVRVDGRSMLNTAIACGYMVTGDEALLTIAVRP